MKQILFALLLCLGGQDKIDDLFRRLGHRDVDVRDRAMERLRALGGSALDSLRKHQDDPDLEVRERTRALLRELEREEIRKLRLSLITLSVSNITVGELIQELRKQAWLRLDGGEVDRNRRVTIHAKDAPLLQVLHQAGLTHGKQIGTLVERKLPMTSAYIPGGGFVFRRSTWIQENQTAGTVFHTASMREFEGELEWEVVRIRAGGDQEFLKCSRHSPGVVFVEDSKLADAVVTLRGVRRWYRATSVEFLSPSEGDTRHVGSYSLELRWPSVIVRSALPMAKDVLDRTCAPCDIQVRVKPGREWRGSLRSSSSCVDIEFCGVELEGTRVWCGCNEAPARQEKARRNVVPERRVEYSGTSREAPLEHLDSITVLFHEPIEERFEVTSPVLGGP